MWALLRRWAQPLKNLLLGSESGFHGWEKAVERAAFVYKEFLALAPKIPIKTEIHTYFLSEANQALDDLRQGRFTGAAVLMLDPSKHEHS
ncbi:hypothetical protein [Legionella oakridgensis]|uniref:Uncharacterized protein n=2 Tax=Legionella oakridgensis TaxID=29423 RepID=W0BE35_9GAMM|nr:hypothetical protein Loa_01329 [Legionella oakridgensis ATCC 33761 = DSM 21215]KTD39769.1 hypothetical protein Loak_0876 [Legionella oakridgensis]STY19990.1 alcohol dehydrogenase [Legionella longbeachae]